MTDAKTYNLADLFELVADAVPDRTALVSSQRRLSYRELDQRATQLANYWAGKGIGQGDHIGLQLRNGTEYLESMLAAYKLRAVAINVNFNYVAGELEYLYRDADMVAIVSHREFAPRVAEVAGKLDKLQHLFCVDDDSGAIVDASFTDYESAIESGSTERNFPPRDSDDIYIVYTGGTTGMPKGVMWHHRDIFFAAMGGGNVEQIHGPITAPEQLVDRIGESLMVTLPTPPFMHAAAQWVGMMTLFSGGKVVITPYGYFKPPAIWQSIADEQVTLMAIVGDAMAAPLAEALAAEPGRWNTSSLQMIASGGALFSPISKERLIEQIPQCMIMDTLGSSETGVMGNKFSSEQNVADREPVFMVNETMTVLDDDDSPLQPGSDKMGRLARKGHVPIGYYNAPEKSASTFVEIDGERWAIPGDLATVEADGSINLLGRGSVSINSGGEKIFPEEVESAVKEYEQIQDAVVVGVDDERYGEKVVVVCQTRDGEDISVDELREFCQSRLANYKLPRAVVCLESIKRSPAGKADYPWAKEAAINALS